MLVTMSGTRMYYVVGTLWLLTSLLTLPVVPAQRIDKHSLESLMARQQAVFRNLLKDSEAVLTEDGTVKANSPTKVPPAGHGSSGLLAKTLNLVPAMGGLKPTRKSSTAWQRPAASKSARSLHPRALSSPLINWWLQNWLSAPGSRLINLSSHRQSAELHKDEGFYSTSSSDRYVHPQQNSHPQTQPWTYIVDMLKNRRRDQPWTYYSSYDTVPEDGVYAGEGEQAMTPTDLLQGREDYEDDSTGSSQVRRVRAVSRYSTPTAQSMLTPRQQRYADLPAGTAVTGSNLEGQTGTKHPQESRSSSESLYPALDQFLTTGQQHYLGAERLYGAYPTPTTARGDASSRYPVHNPSPAPYTPWYGSLSRRANTRAPTAAPQTLAPWPTRAPATRLSPETTTTATTPSSTPYPQPTPRVPLLGQVAGSAQDPLVSKRTSDPTPAAGLSSDTVCLQYVRVEHDVDCRHRSRRAASPSSHQLALLLQHLGRSPSSPFTAPSLQEAVSSFRNLMPLGLPDVDEHVHLKFTTSRIQELLDKHYAEKNQSKSTKSVPRFENGDASKLEADDFQLPADYLQQLVPMKYVTVNSTLQRSRRSFDPANHHSYACPNTVDCTHFDSSQCPNGQTEMIVDENDCDTCQCAASGSGSGYCQHSGAQGSGVQNPRTRLCTQCQRIRHLGPDVFPSYLQEVVCHPSHAPCLDIGGALGPQGQCQESQVPVSVLRRNPGRCMRIELTNGQSLVFDDWRLAQQMVRTGCQCMVDKRSPVAAVLPHS